MVFKNLIIILALSFFSANLFAKDSQTTATQPIDRFTTDGCSIPLKGLAKGKLEKLINKVHFCCIKHDVDYWMGGTRKNRRDADAALRICVDKAVPPTNLFFSSWGERMEAAVRIGGRPSYAKVPSIQPYRWGYGYPIGRPYMKAGINRSVYEVKDISSKLKELRADLVRPSAPEIFKVRKNHVQDILEYVDTVIKVSK